MSGENYETEKTQLIVDSLLLNGLESEYVATNAVSKAYVDTKVQSAVDSLVNGASSAVDTLKELNDVLSAVDSTLALDILTKIGDEKKDRETADAVLTAAISTEAFDRQNEIIRIEQNYQSADTLASGRIDNLSMGLESEISARNTGDFVLNDRIDTLSLGLENELANRSYGDAQLNGRVDNISMVVEGLQDSKANKSGATFTGDVTLEDAYLQFGLSWRVKASGDGSKILFQHKKADNIWRTAVPFICSV
jgi:hypothetical protein